MGVTPTAPATLLGGAYVPLSNAAGNATAPSSTLPVRADLTGGVGALVLSGLGLNGTLPASLRELRTARWLLLSRNALGGVLPPVGAGSCSGYSFH